MMKNRYEFECNITEEKLDSLKGKIDYIDEWGLAFLWLDENEKQGVELNLYGEDIDTTKEKVCAGIYKTGIAYSEKYPNGVLETDYSTCDTYGFNPYNSDWKNELEGNMLKAALQFF